MKRMRSLSLTVCAVLAFAAFASASTATAAPSEFEAEEYPAIAIGDGKTPVVANMNIAGASMYCTPGDFEDGLTASSPTLSTETNNGLCYNNTKSESAPIKMNGCDFSFESGVPGGGGQFSGTATIGPPGCGPVTIQFSIWCTYSLYPGSDLGTFRNLKSGEVETYAHFDNLKYTTTGGSCGKQEGTTGQWLAGWGVRGTSSISGEPIDFLVNSGSAYLIGEAPQVFLNADVFPTSIASSGTDTFTFKINAGTFTCTQTGLSAVVIEATTNQPLNASFAACKGNGYPSLVKMNSCRFDLGIEGVEPYAGNLGVSCTKVGDGIEFSAYLNEKYAVLLCKGKILPQSGHKGVDLANVFNPETGIELDAAVEGVTYEQTGAYCESPNGKYSNGVLAGGATLLGS